MVLRKCPSCKETVGAESGVCPRCGTSFRAAHVRRIMKWSALVCLAAWTVGRYVHRFM